MSTENFSLGPNESLMLARLKQEKRIPACILDWERRIELADQAFLLYEKATARDSETICKSTDWHQERMVKMRVELDRRNALWVRGRINDV